MTTRFDDALAQAASGADPDTIALMRILVEANSEEQARAGLAVGMAALQGGGELAGAERLRRLHDLWSDNPQAWSVVRHSLDVLAHDRTDVSAAETLRYWAEAFDKLAASSPEGSVALYSFGSPTLLAEATAEVVSLLEGWRLIAPDRDLLDLGCGIGRFLVALAPNVLTILGLDISAGMVTEARRRTVSLANVRVEQANGQNLDGIDDESLDFVLAADVMPYLVQAGGGLAEAHVSEFARVLRPGGSVLVLNWSYRGDLAADRADAASACAACGLSLTIDGDRPLALWDAAAFLMRRTG